MSSRGPYDHSVQNIETAQTYESDKDKDFEIAVIDGVHDTRVSTEIEKRKNKLYE
jgi:hypothetical protein